MDPFSRCYVGRAAEEGTAYKCYCSKERLEALREEQMAKGEKPVKKPVIHVVCLAVNSSV